MDESEDKNKNSFGNLLMQYAYGSDSDSDYSLETDEDEADIDEDTDEEESSAKDIISNESQFSSTAPTDLNTSTESNQVPSLTTQYSDISDISDSETSTHEKLEDPRVTSSRFHKPRASKDRANQTIEERLKLYSLDGTNGETVKNLNFESENQMKANQNDPSDEVDIDISQQLDIGARTEDSINEEGMQKAELNDTPAEACRRAPRKSAKKAAEMIKKRFSDPEILGNKIDDSVDDSSDSSDSNYDGDKPNFSDAGESTEELSSITSEKSEIIDENSLEKTESTDENITAYEKGKSSSQCRKIFPCSICLGRESDDTDELVQCDGCKIVVHENCFGICATEENCELDKVSHASSASTEPWFCDVCVAGEPLCMCELCPLVGGVLKHTTKGRWVHLICALYTPNITFEDNKRLTGIDISKANPTQKACYICLNKISKHQNLVASTGLPVKCDAGMCRQFMHITCAQQEGQLHQVTSEDLNSPYFVYCRTHVDKDESSYYRQLFRALPQSSQLYFAMNISQSCTELTNDNFKESRLQRKLSEFRKDLVKKKKSSFQEFTETDIPVTPRFLHNSPFAVVALTYKASKIHDIQTSNFNDSHFLDAFPPKKFSYVAPKFECDFFMYYTERNESITNLRKDLKRLSNRCCLLKDMQRDADLKKANITSDLKKSTTKCENLTKKAQELWSNIGQICKRVSSMKKNQKQGWEIKCPKFITMEKLIPNSFDQISFFHENLSMKKELTRKVNETEPERTSSPMPKRMKKNHTTTTNHYEITKQNILDSQCSICRQFTDSHLLAYCSTCTRYFHIYCLVPPMEKVPKQSRNYSWQCDDCAPASDEDVKPEDVLLQKVAGDKERLAMELAKPRSLRPPTTTANNSNS